MGVNRAPPRGRTHGLGRWVLETSLRQCDGPIRAYPAEPSVARVCSFDREFSRRTATTHPLPPRSFQRS